MGLPALTELDLPPAADMPSPRDWRRGAADTTWFKARFLELGILAKDAAKAANIPQHQMSRVIHGERRWSPGEGERLAAVLKVPLGELFYRTGYGVPAPSTDPAPGTKGVAILGWIDSQGNVTWEPDHTVKALPLLANVELQVIRVWDVRTSYHLSLLYFEPKKTVELEDTRQPLPCVVHLKSGEDVVRFLKAGSRPGTWKLVRPEWIEGQPRESDEDTDVVSASPIRFIAAK